MNKSILTPRVHYTYKVMSSYIYYITSSKLTIDACYTRVHYLSENVVVLMHIQHNNKFALCI